MDDICKHCGHSHSTWPVEAARCDKKRVESLERDNKAQEEMLSQKDATIRCLTKRHKVDIKRVESLESVLTFAIKELECSGLCNDHPTILRLEQALKGR